MIISRYAKDKEITVSKLEEVTIDNERIRNIIKSVEQRIN